MKPASGWKVLKIVGEDTSDDGERIIKNNSKIDGFEYVCVKLQNRNTKQIESCHLSGYSTD